MSTKTSFANFRWLTRIAVIGGLMGVMLYARSASAAISYGGVSIDPTLRIDEIRHYYAFIISEGESVNDAIVVANTSDETKTIMLYGGNWVLDKEKDYALEKPDLPADAPQNTGDWITFEKNRITLKPGASTQIGFTINVPANADVGDFQGEIYAQEVLPEGQSKGSGFSLYARVGTSVYVTVPGEIKRDLVIKRITHLISRSIGRKLTFRIFFENHGNVKLTPLIDIKMRGLFGAVGEQKDVKYGTIARDQKVALDGEWVRRAPYFGRFVADFTFHLPEREQVNKDRTKTMLPPIDITKRYVFWVLPLTEIIYLLLAVFIAYLLRSIWLYYLIVNRLKTKTEVYTVVKDDTLTKIAAKLGADPRVLAKFNLLRWPYELKPGEKLLIPVGRLAREEWRERLGTVLGYRAIIARAFSHLFGRRNVHEISKKMQGITGHGTDPNYDVLVADRGDTVYDIADFAKIEPEDVIRINRLRPPYRLRAGQELLVPKAKSKTSARPKTTRKTTKKRK